MHKILLTTLFIALISYSKGQSNRDFVDKVIDLTIETSTGEEIELPDLYSTLALDIPNDSTERLIIVQRLKTRGFKVTSWARGNMPPLGPRIIMIELKKDNCTCSVSKIYYNTIEEKVFHAVERFSCERSPDLNKNRLKRK